MTIEDIANHVTNLGLLGIVIGLLISGNLALAWVVIGMQLLHIKITIEN